MSEFKKPERIQTGNVNLDKDLANYKAGLATSFIDRAIAMLKDEYKLETNVAGYNGIVSLLNQAKESLK